MRTRRVRSLAALSGTLFLLSMATACSSSSDSGTNPEVNPLIGTWHVTSFNATGLGDVIQAGMTVTATFAEDKSYTLAITGDQVGACNTGTSCTQSGTWSTSGSTISLSQTGTSDVTTFTYSISGSTMTWTGSIDSVPVTISMTKS